MIFSPRILYSAAAIGITCMVTAAAYYYKTRMDDFSDFMIYRKVRSKNYDKLMSFVESAKNSIDVCMPSVHDCIIRAGLLKALRNKIKLRIIMDHDAHFEPPAFILIQQLTDVGAEIKYRIRGTYDQESQFCLIDGKILISGALAWCKNLTDKWKHIYVTDKPHFVEPARKAFDHKWRNDPELEETLNLKDTMSCESDFQGVFASTPNIADKLDRSTSDDEDQANLNTTFVLYAATTPATHASI